MQLIHQIFRVMKRIAAPSAEAGWSRGYLKSAANLVASVLNVGEEGDKGQESEPLLFHSLHPHSHPPRSGVLLISRLFGEGIHRWAPCPDSYVVQM